MAQRDLRCRSSFGGVPGAPWSRNPASDPFPQQPSCGSGVPALAFGTEGGPRHENPLECSGVGAPCLGSGREVEAGRLRHGSERGRLEREGGSAGGSVEGIQLEQHRDPRQVESGFDVLSGPAELVSQYLATAGRFFARQSPFVRVQRCWMRGPRLWEAARSTCLPAPTRTT